MILLIGIKYPTQHPMLKKIVGAHNTNFSNVKKIETNGFQNVGHTKKH
jgi:hypothetical protein